MKSHLSRRDFTKLTSAALGGLVAGSMFGCGKSDDDAPAPAGGNEGSGDAPPADGSGAPDGSGTANEAAADDKKGHDPQLLLTGKNVCRGLNHTCANHKGGDNQCAGQGQCATAAEHACHGENECKGQGGCGEYPGQNLCKAQGKCAVPLSDKAWKTARTAFEKTMADAGKEFGPAPG